MIVYFCTDLHSKDDFVAAMEREFKLVKPDFIVIGGDLQSWPVAMLDTNRARDVSWNFYSDLVARLEKHAPVFVVYGNHDVVDGRCTQVINAPFKIDDNLWVVAQSGSSSTLLAEGLPERDKNYWHGHPFGPGPESQQFDDFRQWQAQFLQRNTAALAEIRKNGKGELQNPGHAAYNEKQTFDLTGVPADAQLFVISHQGPYCSPTACDDCYGVQFSSGSPQNQEFYDANKHRIAAWLHGHTHGPILRRNGPLVNPGTSGEGNWCWVEIGPVQGGLGVVDVKFASEEI